MSKKRKKYIKPEKLSVADSIQVFLKLATLDLITAVRAACRKKFPQTVAELDALSELELDAVRAGGLLALPKSKVSAIENAMKKDEFIWS